MSNVKHPILLAISYDDLHLKVIALNQLHIEKPESHALKNGINERKHHEHPLLILPISFICSKIYKKECNSYVFDPCKRHRPTESEFP